MVLIVLSPGTTAPKFAQLARVKDDGTWQLLPVVDGQLMPTAGAVVVVNRVGGPKPGPDGLEVAAWPILKKVRKRPMT